MTITIPDELIEQAHLSPNDLRTDLAAYLYEHRRLTLEQARRLAGMDLIAFQHALAARDIDIQFGIDDLEKDVRNLNLLQMLVVCDTSPITNPPHAVRTRLIVSR